MVIELITRKEAIKLGLKRYYTGKECKHGHVAERRVSNGYCLECEYNKVDRTPKSDTIRAAAKRLIGTKVGELTVYNVNWSKGHGDSRGAYVNCICSCGNFSSKNASSLETSKHPSCGCALVPDENKYDGILFSGCGGEELRVTKYINANNVHIKFVKSGYEKTNVQMSQIRSGTVKDINTPSVYGVGINDCMTDVNNSKVYKKWQAMLERCYCTTGHKRYEVYAGCKVNNSWHKLSEFKKWCDAQCVEDLDGYELDKDLLIYGNSEYSASTCKLIPKNVNVFLVGNDINRGLYPLGVSKDKTSNKYKAQCQNPLGSGYYIGTFSTVEDAFKTYCETKNKYAIDIVNYYKDILDEETKAALQSRYLPDGLLVIKELADYYNRIGGLNE